MFSSNKPVMGNSILKKFHVQNISHNLIVAFILPLNKAEKRYYYLGSLCMVYIGNINIAGETFIIITALIILYIWFKKQSRTSPAMGFFYFLKKFIIMEKLNKKTCKIKNYKVIIVYMVFLKWQNRNSFKIFNRLYN